MQYPGYFIVATSLEQCLTTVFAPDEDSEAVLRLEMSSDVEILNISFSASHSDGFPVM